MFCRKIKKMLIKGFWGGNNYKIVAKFTSFNAIVFKGI